MAEKVSNTPERKKKKVSDRSRNILIALLAVLLILIAVVVFILTRTKPDPRSGQEPNYDIDFNDEGDEHIGVDETADPEAPMVDKEKAEQLLDPIEDNELTKDEGWRHYLLLGVDGTGYKSARSDALIVLSVNKDEQRVVLSSIPRDTFVYVEGKGMSKINGAYMVGGADLAVKTFEENFDIDIENYFVVNFESLPKIVDLVGGVTLTLTDAEAHNMGEYYAAWGLEGGTQKLNGKEVLAYCRVRKIDSDYKRNDRQFNALMAVYNAVKKMSYDQYVGLAKIAFDEMYSDMMVGNMLLLLKDVMDILDVSEVEHVKLVDSEHSKAGNVGGYGSIVMMDNLVDTVIRWRESLGIEGYTPSKRVEQISKRIDETLGR